MKLEFKFGYIHSLTWLVLYNVNPSIGTCWNKMRELYNKYWQLDSHGSLTRPEAEEIINSLRKL